MTALRRVPAAERRARLLTRHHLTPGTLADGPVRVAETLLGLHATDAATVYLAALARMATPSVQAVEDAFYTDRTLVRALCMRRTMFAVPADLASLVHAAAGRPVAVRERAGLVKYLAEGGWDEAWLRAVEKSALAALARLGEATAGELAEAEPRLREEIVVAPGKPYETRQAVGSRILRCLAADGHIRRCRPRGTWTSSQFRWALAEPHEELPAPEARAELARRWLAAYGPATVADLKWWTGWTLGETRKALAAIEAVPVELDGGPGVLLPEDEDRVAEPEPVALLLPALDPTAMGWRDRDFYLPEQHREALFDRTGNIGPTVWWRGRIVGAWAHRADGSVAHRLLEDVDRKAARAVAAEAERVTGWLAGVRVTPRFRTPLERELAG